MIEHQNTVDYKVAKRISNYCSVVVENDECYRKKAIDPIRYPIYLLFLNFVIVILFWKINWYFLRNIVKYRRNGGIYGKESRDDIN